MSISLFRISNRKYSSLVFYAVLSLLIMGPLFKPGYMFTLDASSIPLGFGNHIFGHGSTEWAPYHLIAGLIDLVLPHWIVQKTIWFLALLLASLGAHKLCPARNKTGKYFAGILYMINPFIYARLLAGQSLFILSYALIPFAVYYFLGFLEKGDKKSLILTALIATIVSTLTLQMLFLIFLAFLVILIVRMIQQRRDGRYLLDVTKKVGLLSAVFLLLNIYWLVPLLTSESSPLNQIGPEDMLYFAPWDTTGFGAGISILSLHGFWLHGSYLYTKDVFPAWWLTAAFILFLSIYGAATYWGNKEHGVFARSMIVIAVIATILAIGVSSSITRPLFTFLWEQLFFFPAFRDSQKFVALLVLAYSFLGGLGVAKFADGLTKTRTVKIRFVFLTTLVAFALITPLLNCFTMFNSFWGQIKPTDFPRDWYEVNEFLNEDSDDFNVIFLPWHSYIDYGWLPQSAKRTRNFARSFFDKPVITGDNIEIGEIYTQSLHPVSHYVEFLFGLPEQKGRDMTNLGELASLVNAKYLLLTKEADWKWYYELLSWQEDLTLVKETSHLLVFKNEHRTARIYQVGNVAYIEDWDELLKRSKSEDVVDYLYLVGKGEGTDNPESGQPVPYRVKSPARYLIDESVPRYIVFAPTQEMNTNHWEYNGKKSLKHLGFMPSFRSNDAGGVLVYSRFYRVYLPSYIVSLVVIASMIWYYFRRGTRNNRL